MSGVLNVYDGQNWKPTGVVINQDITQYVSPFNYADNSDFTQWVAQAGIGGNHGSQAYGGDRWILDSGTITGTARADGSGYENITLNGTIRQIVANPPAVGTVGVDMISGTATATYANGEITITSSGGVPKDVWLYEGSYENGAAPKYQPKGYGEQLARCLRYFVRAGHSDVAQNMNYFGLVRFYSNVNAIALLPLPVQMRSDPVTVINGTFLANGLTVTEMTATMLPQGLRLRVKVADGATAGDVGYLENTTAGAYVDFIADL